MRRILFVFFVVAFCLTCRVTGYAQQQALVAGWNIEGVEAIPEERIAEIAAVVRKLSPDIIVLSEVNTNDAPAKIVQHLGSDYQAPVIIAQKPTVVQNLALIFKTGVSVSDARLIEGTDLAEEPRSRRALTANVRIGNFDFILIGVHLKSSRDATSRKQRTRQCQALARFIAAAVTGSEKDVLVIGDYNMIPRMGTKANDEVNFVAMSPTNSLRFVSSDFLLGQTSHIDACNPLRGNLLDGFAISRKFTKEYVAGSTRLISFSGLGSSCAAFRDNVSDHRVIVSRFRVIADDD